jgi:hypothetical protein
MPTKAENLAAETVYMARAAQRIAAAYATPPHLRTTNQAGIVRLIDQVRARRGLPPRPTADQPEETADAR